MSEVKSRSYTQFPSTFWSANVIELFERAAYYAVASFVVVYLHEILGMAPTKATFLNGTILWGIVYFLPILSGTLADKFGFKRSLKLAFGLITAGYLVMGGLQRFWPMLAGENSVIDYTFPVVIGILLIGIGGSFVKPCISGTIQKTSGTQTTLGFAVFYMTINIGSMTGRMVAYFVRTQMGIPAIFMYVATSFALIGLLIVWFIYKEPVYQDQTVSTQKPKTLSQALIGMVTVLKNIRFVFFLFVIGFFWFIYVQIYNLIPLFLRHLDSNAPVELYTIINPVMIVCFQLLITRFSKSWSSIKSIMTGVGVTVVGMLLNIVPAVLNLDPYRGVSWGIFWMPLGGIFILISIASMAVGEMLASPRIYQYIGAIAPKGQEGLFLGYANLPMAIGTIIGAPIGGILFETFVEKPIRAGGSMQASIMWLIVAGMGLISILGLYVYDRTMIRHHT